MQLLLRIAANTNLTELLSSAEIAEAEAYEAKGWVIIRRAPMSKGRDTYGQQTVYAQITDAGRRQLDHAPTSTETAPHYFTEIPTR